jgi:signal transduction histidine kinase
LISAIRRQALVTAKHTGIKAHLELPEDFAAIDHDIEVALYRSVQEALHNVAKHSRATTFTVRLSRSGNKISLQIEDDGVGFSPRTAPERGFGITGLRERAAALGGSVRIHSESGHGTQIRILLPLLADRHSKPATASNPDIHRHLTAARAS